MTEAMYRSAVLATLAVGITLALLTAELQPAERVWRIGYLGGGSRERIVDLVEALESGLRDLGYVEGRNAIFEHRFADGRLERLPDLAAEMVRSQLDVIVASNPQIVAVEQALRVAQDGSPGWLSFPNPVAQYGVTADTCRYRQRRPLHALALDARS